MDEMGLRGGDVLFWPIVSQPLAYLDRLELGSPKVNDNTRSENGLGSRELEEKVILARGKREEEANIRCDGWFCNRRQSPSTTSHKVGMARCAVMSVL